MATVLTGARGVLLTLAFGAAFIGQSTAKAQLRFNGLTGVSNMATVEKAFPGTVKDRICSGATARFADGVTRCETLSVSSYKLAGYNFQLDFFFNENGTLQTAGLKWPRIVLNPETPNSQEIENAYWALAGLFASKYGRAVDRPPCAYLRHCMEGQLDRSTTWRGGGERIAMAYETGQLSPGVRITYTFVDTGSFSRF